MDTAIYTLIGALGGVLITQLANYFLETKKSQSQRELKSMELAQAQKHELHRDRRLAYSKYLEEVDKAATSNPRDLSICVGDLYKALIVASDETTKEINKVFNFLRQGGDWETQDFLNAKGKLLKAMQRDLQD
ncbi:MAG: hypothetical protein ACTH6I_04805 [Vibrio litoralis]|uniref:hypothetical protein n=1 Tax=Vibrio litoralis TaxID=335972 RepID=UPI003F9C5699